MGATSVLVLLLLAMLVLFDTAYSKKMWGSRRKKEEAEEDSAAANLAFEQKRRAALMEEAIKADFSAGSSGGALAGGAGAGAGALENLLAGVSGGGLGGGGAGMEQLIDMYLTMVEQLMDSEDFDKIVSPEAIQNIFANIPGLSENPEIEQFMNSPELNNPALLRKTMKEGIQAIRQYSSEIVDTFTDPVKLAALMEQLPPEARTVVEALQTGDMSGLLSMIDQIPGIDPSQKKMLSSMLSGDTSGMTQELQKLMGDGDQAEAARQQFLSTPGMAEALGIPDEVLNDPKKWAELMSEGMEMMMKGLGGGSGGEEATAAGAASTTSARNKQNRFANARAA